MSLFNLKSLVSKEDFADAHEPVNDGVKDVPNAQTIAASVKSADTGTDTNNAGPAKVIPEKEDTDDATEKQFDTVGEKTTKGDSGTAPAKSDAGAEDTQTDSTDGATKAPPFVKKDEAEITESEGNPSKPVDAPLEHETKEAAEDEQKKTEKVTESLESYAQHAPRFDIVGYPNADREKLTQRMNWLARRTGNATNVTISTESITKLAEAGRARVQHLAKQVERHEQRKVSAENYEAVVDQAVAGLPTEHGSEPLPAEVAEAITEREIMPLDVDTTGIIQVQDAIQTLHEGQVALEKHLAIIRGTKRISKQAAAVLQAGLEHIDQVCGLKVRATGLEGYDTSPKAAMEDAEVNEKSLLDRAGEIGAKILQFLRELSAKAKVMWQKYESGVASVQTKMVAVKKEVDALKGTPTSQSLDVTQTSDAFMFIGKEFVGDAVSDEEMLVSFELGKIMNTIQKEISGPVLAILRNGSVDEETLEKIHEVLDNHELDVGNGKETELPGGYTFKVMGPAFSIEKGQPARSTKVPVADMTDPGQLKRNFAEIYKFTGKLADADQIDVFVTINEKLTQELISLRKRAQRGMFDEELYQRIQSTAAHITDRYFNLSKYFEVMGVLAKAQASRAKVYHWLAQAWNNSYQTDD
jgi:hypothetical protein